MELISQEYYCLGPISQQDECIKLCNEMVLNLIDRLSRIHWKSPVKMNSLEAMEMSQMIKTMWFGFVLSIAGVASWILERLLYGGRLDENNVLQESFFLPLAFILIFAGGALIVVAAALFLLNRVREARD